MRARPRRGGEEGRSRPRTRGILVHETAHERAHHHGDDFRRAVEEMAGRLARLCLERSQEILNLFGDLK